MKNKNIRIYNSKKIFICRIELLKNKKIAFFNMNDHFRGLDFIGIIENITFESVFSPAFDNKNKIIYLPGVNRDKDNHIASIVNKRVLKILFGQKTKQLILEKK